MTDNWCTRFGLTMLRCCGQLPADETEECIFMKKSVSSGSLSSQSTSSLKQPAIREYSLEFMIPNAENLTKLNSVQPNVKRSLAERKRTQSGSSDGGSIRSRSRLSTDSRGISEDQSPTLDDVDAVSDVIRESLLLGDFIADSWWNTDTGREMRASNPSAFEQGKDYTISKNSLGTIHFSLEIIPEEKRVEFHLEMITGLPCKGRGIVYDPVVVLTILPDKIHTKTSKVICNTLSPHINETFNFPLYLANNKKSRVIRLTVCDDARRKKHMEIGYVLCPLAEEDFDRRVTRSYQTKIGNSSIIHGHIGEMFLSLSYSQVMKSLTVNLLRGRKLAFGETSGYSELYAKVNMLCAGEKVKTKKSKIISKSPNPFINQQFAFVVPSEYFDDLTIMVSLMLKGRFKRNIVLGRVIVGPYSQRGTSPLNYWGLLLLSNKTIKRWFTLCL